VPAPVNAFDDEAAERGFGETCDGIVTARQEPGNRPRTASLYTAEAAHGLRGDLVIGVRSVPF
jgi:hypothetical protein